ncbi:hypothetical protein CONCODRAFT_33884 [Conidiobolus coronatus NRRL 28638]|uniref:Uncharacterized protein n=1 Tax=Conidiobolus coronatus (strain ATCC 28846 / CBS 209.66 / NRRL 28638) TaxID=796925 RepID=A0A137PJ64_CONC2|nr:hypothetical protein CONCODRAFT_33884 [Conidiobolus coronatus NRRL 28638]|eukprot:KXN75042.1 hypothetical protein CONCODRAFT_33884 [Conidiobolus coronatus NRRL 28638]
MSQSDTTNILQGDFSPIERIFLSANGNLQRLLSSYYNQKIYIEFVKNIEKFDDANNLKIYDREVNLFCQSELICNAVSTITVTDKKIRKLIESGEVGIGQVFRYLSILPNFKLIWIKRKLNNQQLIRQYTLSIPGFECLITETFHPEFLSLTF